MSRKRIEAALDRINMVRGMLKHFLADLRPEEWLLQPQGVTSIAWQAGHIAAAQHGLCLNRVRGERDEDSRYIPPEFRKKYGRGSVPTADPAANATPEELLAMLDTVAAQAAEELGGFTDQDLDVPLEQPHPMFKTKLAAVEFCPSHELLHIGQIVLLRRLIGRQPGF